MWMVLAVVIGSDCIGMVCHSIIIVDGYCCRWVWSILDYFAFFGCLALLLLKLPCRLKAAALSIWRALHCINTQTQRVSYFNTWRFPIEFINWLDALKLVSFVPVFPKCQETSRRIFKSKCWCCVLRWFYYYSFDIWLLTHSSYYSIVLHQYLLCWMHCTVREPMYSGLTMRVGLLHNLLFSMTHVLRITYS